MCWTHSSVPGLAEDGVMLTATAHDNHSRCHDGERDGCVWEEDCTITMDLVERDDQGNVQGKRERERERERERGSLSTFDVSSLYISPHQPTSACLRLPVFDD